MKRREFATILAKVAALRGALVTKDLSAVHLVSFMMGCPAWFDWIGTAIHSVLASEVHVRGATLVWPDEGLNYQGFGLFTGATSDSSGMSTSTFKCSAPLQKLDSSQIYGAGDYYSSV